MMSIEWKKRIRVVVGLSLSSTSEEIFNDLIIFLTWIDFERILFCLSWIRVHLIQSQSVITFWYVFFSWMRWNGKRGQAFMERRTKIKSDTQRNKCVGIENGIGVHRRIHIAYQHKKIIWTKRWIWLEVKNNLIVAQRCV